MHLQRTLIATILMIAATLPASAATSYVAPLGAKVSAKADGSKARPWASVNAALGKARAGDTILLMDGDHGRLELKDYAFDKPVMIQSERDMGAHIDSAKFSGISKNIQLKNLKVWRAEGGGLGNLISSSKGTSAISLEGLDIRSRENALDYLNWNKARWREVANDAVSLLGSQNLIRNNTIRGVGYGIIVGRRSLVENNIIDGFSHDGMRGANETTFRNNLIKNCVNVDKTHNDGIQSYAGAANVTKLRIEGNTIIEWNRETPSPLRGVLQGIGLFDGYYDDLVIQNNTVATRSPHGIAVLGARGASIINNTVVQINGMSGKTPWIVLDARKQSRGGGASRDVLIANNIAMGFIGKGDAVGNVVFKNNTVITNPDKVLQTLIDKGYLQASVKTRAGLSRMVLLALGTPDNFFLRTPPASASAPQTGGGASLDPSPIPLPAPLIPLLSALGLLGGLAGFRRLKAGGLAA